MPLPYQPKRMEVVMCDFSGFVAPEMVKTRPVVVFRAHKRNKKLVTVVPLSTTEPTYMEDCHHELSACPLPDQPDATRVWAKCDMLYTVSTDRLNKYKKKREYFTLSVGKDDFDAIRKGILSALGINEQIEK